MAEGSPSSSSPSAAGSGSGGAPNRPLPPTPDEDESQGEKTLVLRRVSFVVDGGLFYFAHQFLFSQGRVFYVILLSCTMTAVDGQSS